MGATLDELGRLPATTAYLWVLEGNDRARRFYERQGWTSDDVTKTLDMDGLELHEVRYSRETPSP